MSVPKYYEFFPSVLNCLSDGKEHSIRELYEYCANAFNLTESDKAETISSGMPVYMNRVGWARTYLCKAGLVAKVSRAIYKITPSGIEAIKDGLENINLEYLAKYDSFNEFLDISYKKDNKITEKTTITEQSPQEQIDFAVSKMNASIADDLMAEILQISPYKFEELIVKLLIKMGYGTLKQNKDSVTKKSGDEGIDGIVTADKFGFDSIYTQAKRWKPDSKVGRQEIQKFLGALAGQGATKGLFITTATFTKEAIEYASRQLQHKIVLVDGNQLTDLMIDYNLGVSTINSIEIKKVDYDFFIDED